MPRRKLTAPAGYDEGGKTLAEAVVEASQPKRWAADLAELLGYTRTDLDAWIAWYQRTHRERLKRLSDRLERKQAKLESIRQRIQELGGS